MEPPPLTVSKRKDPLRDGFVFQHSDAARSSPRCFSMQRPRQTGAASYDMRGGSEVPTALWTSAAEAAAVNRSVEAQNIKRSWEALIGASPLPQAVRRISSPAIRTLHLSGSFGSPAAPLPFLRDLYTAPANAYQGTASQLQGSARHDKGTAQAAAQAQGSIPAARGMARPSLPLDPPAVHVDFGVDGRGMAGSLVQQQLDPRPQLYAPRNEITSGNAAGNSGNYDQFHHLALRAQQQQQQRWDPGLCAPFNAAAAAPQQATVPTLPLPLIYSRPAALDAAQPQLCSSTAAPREAAAGHEADPGAWADHLACPISDGIPIAAAPVGLCFDERGGAQGEAAGAALVTSQQPASTSGPTETPSAVRTQIELGQEACSIDMANAQVGSLVRDFCSPTPGKVDALSAPLPQPPAASRRVAKGGDEGVSHGGAGQGAERSMTEGAEGRGRRRNEHCDGGAAGGTGGVEDGAPFAPQRCEEAIELADGKGQGRQQSVGHMEGEFTPGDGHAGTSGKGQGEGRPSTAVAAGPAAAADTNGGGGPSCLNADPGASTSALIHPSSRTRPADSHATKKRPKLDKGEATSKQRTMLTRGEAAHLQPILRSMGNMEGVQVTRSGRPRIKPLPYWTNTRLVVDSRRDIVGIEQREDLLGLSGAAPPQGKPQAQGTKVAKASAGKAAPGTSKAETSGPPKQTKSATGPGSSNALAGGKQAGPGGKVSGAPGGEGKGQRPNPAERRVDSKQVSAPGRARGKQPAAGGKRAGATQGKKRPTLPDKSAATDLEAELQAAQQLQEMSQGGITGDTAAPSHLGPPEDGMQQLAAIAASAGARAAKEVGKLKAAGCREAGMASTTGRTNQGQSRTQHKGRGPASGSEQPAPMAAPEGLPAVEGVPAEVLGSLAALPARQRRRCHHCKHCRHATGKQVCLALQALRGMDKAAVAHTAAGTGSGQSQQTQKQGRHAGQQARHQAGDKTVAASPAGAAAEPADPPLQAATKGASEGEKLPKQQMQQQRGRPQQDTQRDPPLAPAGATGGGKKRGAGEAGVQRAKTSKKAKAQLSGPPPVGEHSQGVVLAEQEASQPSGSAAGADAAGGTPLSTGDRDQAGGEEAVDEAGWTASQVASLQRAWLQIDPTASSFWQLVAKQVPGKSAKECYNRHMAKHPTPPHPSRRPAAGKYLAAAREGAKLPELKPGASKQVVRHAVRQYARQLQWQERASRAQGLAGEEGVGEEMVEEMQAAERKDRYIDQILRKRQGRPLGMAAKGGRPLPAAAAAATGPGMLTREPGHLRHDKVVGGTRLAGVAAATHEVRAALADLGQPASEDEDSQGGSDYYWSDVEA